MPRPHKPASPFRYFNSSPEVIRLVVMMYVRFPLSLRNVEDLLFERGIDICHETVRMWWNRFGPLLAGDIRRQRVSRVRGFRQWRWHLDEMYVKLGGEMVYLWRAVDQEGEILESFVTKSRDKVAALAFMKKALRRHGSPRGSPPMACARTRRRCMSLATRTNRRSAAVPITGSRTATSRSDDGSERCSASGG
jgi:putative transposase